MQTERKITVLSLLLNTIIVFIEIYAGKVFDSYTLMVLGYFTLTNLCVEFLGFTGSIARGRRANLKEPFGYGKLELMSQSFFGAVLIIIAVFIFLKSFILTYDSTDLRIIFVMLFLYIYKRLNSKLAFNNAKMIQSNMLFDISFNYYIGSIFVIIISFVEVLSHYFNYVDFIGSILMSLVIFYKGFDIIRDSILMLNGQNDQSKSIKAKIKKVVDDIGGITYNDSNLVNVKNYYKATIDIIISDSLSTFDLLKISYKLKNDLKKLTPKIKYVDIDWSTD